MLVLTVTASSSGLRCNIVNMSQDAEGSQHGISMGDIGTPYVV